MTEDYAGSYFNAVVKDAIHEIQKNGSAVVFYKDQVEAVRKVIPNITVKEDDGFFYIRRNNDKRTSI